MTGSHKVVGSIPISSTNSFKRLGSRACRLPFSFLFVRGVVHSLRRNLRRCSARSAALLHSIGGYKAGAICHGLVVTPRYYPDFFAMTLRGNRGKADLLWAVFHLTEELV